MLFITIQRPTPSNLVGEEHQQGR